MNKYVQNFEGEITVMIDDTNLITLPYGVYTFVGSVLVGAFYFETEEEAEKKFLLVCEKMKRVI